MLIHIMAEDQEAVPQTAPIAEPLVDTSEQPRMLEPETRRQLHLAKWSTRFWAWLIDFLLVVLLLNIVRGIFEPFWHMPLVFDIWNWNVAEFTFQTFFFLLYWAVMEGFRGQSIGKMVMNLRVVNRDGSKISYASAAIESFGKAYLLPLDCLIGWLGMPDTKLRVFNRISNTIVINTDYREPAGIIYVKEKE